VEYDSETGSSGVITFRKYRLRRSEVARVVHIQIDTESSLILGSEMMSFTLKNSEI
jgi:hypothetical protein